MAMVIAILDSCQAVSDRELRSPVLWHPILLFCYWTTGEAVTGVVATFDRELDSISSITVQSGGTVANIVQVGSTVTFDITASVAANPGYGARRTPEGPDPDRLLS